MRATFKQLRCASHHDLRHERCVKAMRVRGHSTNTWTEFCRFLTPPLLPAWTFFKTLSVDKNGIFDLLPTNLIHVVIERPLVTSNSFTFVEFQLITITKVFLPLRLIKFNFFEQADKLIKKSRIRGQVSYPLFWPNYKQNLLKLHQREIVPVRRVAAKAGEG